MEFGMQERELDWLRWDWCARTLQVIAALLRLHPCSGVRSVT